jgi:putative chitinase
MDITLSQLQEIMPEAHKRAEIFLSPLNKAMAEFEIITPLQQAAFLAQIAHESEQLLFVKELASGEAYEGRKDLGNTEKGDGVRYKGRGLIQITGRVNYAALMLALNVDCLNHPELIELPENAARSAGWFWKTHHLSEIAEIGTEESFTTITRKINGGINGLASRQAFYKRALEVLGA